MLNLYSYIQEQADFKC